MLSVATKKCIVDDNIIDDIVLDAWALQCKAHASIYIYHGNIECM